MSNPTAATSDKASSKLTPDKATWAILGLGVLLRIASYSVSVNNGGDALARAAGAAAWAQHPTLKFFFGRYLPLHFWMMGGLAFLVHDPNLAARLVSLVLGCASLLLLWIIASTVYDREAANLSLFFFSLYSLHIAYSTTSSSEVPYLCFVLAGLTCFFVYRRSNKLWALGVSGIALSLAGAIRYEAWVVVFALALLLLRSAWQELRQQATKQWMSPLMVFGITAGAWPVFWVLYVWTKMGKPFYFLNEQSAAVKETLALAPRSMLYQLMLTPGVILLTLSPLVVVAGLYALWLSVRERPGREFAFVLVIFAFVQFYSVATRSLFPLARYTISLGAFLAVVSGYGLQQFAGRLFPRFAGIFLRVVLTTVVLNLIILFVLGESRGPYGEKFASISPRVAFPFHIQEVGDYLHSRLGGNDAVVFDNYNVDSNILAAAAGLPLLPGDRAFTFRGPSASAQYCSELLAYMRMRHPRYVVYSDLGTLRPCLPLTQAGTYDGMEFKSVLQNKIYKVYEVTYPN